MSLRIPGGGRVDRAEASAPVRVTTPAPAQAPQTALRSGWAGRLAGFGRRLRTGALVALMVGNSLVPAPARAAMLGAQGVPAGGVEVTWVAERAGPGATLLAEHTRLSAERMALVEQLDAARAEYERAMQRADALRVKVADLTELVALSAGPVAPRPTPPSDPALARFAEVLDQAPDHEAQLEAARQAQAEAEAVLQAADARWAAARGRVEALDAPLAALDRAAWPVLEALGVSAQALQAARGGALTTTPGAAARAAGLLELWLARDPGRSAAAFTPAELYAFMAVRRAAFAGELATQPAELYASPYDVLYAGTASGAPPAQGAPRAKALVEAVGYRPMADDLWVLGRQRPEDVETITSFLGGLKQAGLTFERRYHGFGPLGSPVQGELTHLLSRLPWRSPEGRAGVLAAAAELVALGSPLRPSEAALLAELAGGAGAARARVVLARTAPLDDPRDADYVVKVAREAARFGDDAALAAGLDALGARLGRRPTVPEAAQVLEALQAGAQLEALIPVGGGALAVADLYAWSRAPARYTAAPEAHLRAELDARVSQAFLRLDSNAEYAETSSAAFGAPKLVKMHMLLDALQAPAVRGALADALSADLADGAWEHGGLVKAEGGVATFDVIPSASQDSTAATYLLPAAHEPLPALAKFHFHAVNADGELHRSGPSSVALGQGADRGVTYLYQQDEVVISALDVDAAGRVTRFNVDFVATDGAVRDLGTFTR